MYKMIWMIMTLSVVYLLDNVVGYGECKTSNSVSMCTSAETRSEGRIYLRLDNIPTSNKNISCYCYLSAFNYTIIDTFYETSTYARLPNVTVRDTITRTLNESRHNPTPLDVQRLLIIHYTDSIDRRRHRICIKFAADSTKLQLICRSNGETSLPGSSINVTSETDTASSKTVTEPTTHLEGSVTEKDDQTKNSPSTDQDDTVIGTILGVAGGFVVIIIAVVIVIVCRRRKSRIQHKKQQYRDNTGVEDDDHYNVENALYISADAEVTYDTVDDDILHDDEDSANNVIFLNNTHNKRTPVDKGASSNEYDVVVKDRRNTSHVPDDDTYNHVSHAASQSASATESTYDLTNH